MTHDYFKDYREHTEIKHAILKDYLSAWVPILASWNNKICYIDGFCGPGSYIVGDKIYDGSPIIALKIGESFSVKVSMVCIFIDKKEEYCDQLKERLSQLDFKSKYYIEHGEFENVITDLLDTVPNIVPTFCFIDPFGYSGLPLHVIKRFLKRPTTEVFITFMHESISRFLSVPSQHSHLDMLFGSHQWRHVLELDLRQNKREIFLRDLYHKQLKSCANYVWPFKLTDPDRDRTIYYLFHGTNHPKGIRVMKEIMYQKGTKGTYSYQGKHDSQLALFSAEPKVSELEKFLLDRFAGQQIEYDDIVNSTLEAPFIDKHYREALTNLRKGKIIKKIPVTTKGDKGFRGKDIAVFPREIKKKKKIKGFFD